MAHFKAIEELKGETLVSLEHNSEEAVFTTDSGRRFRMYHEQDCCENVRLDDVVGAIECVLHSPIITAREAIGHGDTNRVCESVTFSDYHIATARGEVVLKWVGESNGYYSESVYFVELKEGA